MESTGLLSVDNGESKIIEAEGSLIAQEYYTDYAKYVLEYRALPSVYDGLKPVQRRIIYIANQQPKKLMKTAKLAGLCMALHPHGSSSIEGALYNMAYPLNRLPLFTTKGNFGGVGASHASSRYTECYLSDIARMNFCQFVDYADYKVGEIGEMEPVALPTLIPYALLEGTEGIAVGLSTKIMPLNLLDLIDYYIDFIKKGKSDKIVKPDVGASFIENDNVKELVSSYRGRLTTSSVVTQISDTSFLIEGLYGRSVDAVINKVDKWTKAFTKGQAGFRDASTTSMKYIFELYDDKDITPQEFKEDLIAATRSNTTFTRVMEENGSAIYSSLDYVVKQSLSVLNRAIDKKIATELERNRKQLIIYEILKRCKELGVFNNITKMTTDELIHKIVVSTDCDIEVAKEIVKRPISYLTRSHDSEEENLKSQIKLLEDHDRVKYLISLYKELRKAVLPIYESRKHSLSHSEVIDNPCIKIDDSGYAQVASGDGLEFDNIVYFVSDGGYIYKRSVDSLVASEFMVSTSHDDKIIGVVTDKFKYVQINTTYTDDDKWAGRLIVELSSVYDGKKVVNLRDTEIISNVSGISRLSESNNQYFVKRVSKTKYIKV